MENKRVLIVHDNATTLKWATEQLQKVQIEVRAKRTAWIFNDLQEFKPRLVLLDVKMGALSGVELIKMLKQKTGSAGVKMVFYSNRTPAELDDYVKKSGADGYIIKGDDAKAFVQAVRQYLS